MYTKNNITYADAGKILRYDGKVGFQLANAQEAEELTLDLTKAVNISDKLVRVDDILNIDVSEPTKKNLKTKIICKRYDSDDQIAIMLNKGKSKEATKEYNLMQDWRAFADELSSTVINCLNER